MATTQHTYRVSFNTPAFLGNAEQQAQWRTPPFKALLRQWWRIANASRCGFNHSTLAKAEAEVFGAASDEGQGSHRSRIQIRLSQWSAGNVVNWPDDTIIKHPEVTANNGQLRPIGAHLYLGYGPLTYNNRRTSLENQDGHKWTAIDSAQECPLLTLRYPDEWLDNALKLLHWFGTLGGRSRNGWGSLHLEPQADTPALPDLSKAALQPFLRDWTECLNLEWPHAIGRDERGSLVWVSKTEHANWSDAMKELAQLKIKFRTALKFTKPKGDFDDRHILAYPVTHHPVNEWGNMGRLANQLRFKLVRQQNGRHKPIVFHLPCGFPTPTLKKHNGIELDVAPEQQEKVWKAVHGVLEHVTSPVQRLT